MAKVVSSDDEAASTTDPEIPRTTFLAVQQWINMPTHVRNSQERALELYTLAPLLFGCSMPRSPEPSSKVLLRMLKAGSIPAEVTATRVEPSGYLSDQQLCRVDYWKATCRRTLRFLSSMAPEQLAAQVTLWQPSKASSMSSQYCEALIKQFSQVVSSSHPDDMCAGLSIFHHFAVYLQRVADTACFDDLLTEHIGLRHYISECEKAVSDIHEMGNRAFKDGLYDLAVDCYTKALRQCPFGPVLYSNRTLAHLKRKDPRSAISDGIKCVNLDPTCVKGMWRFAEALFSIGNDQLAFLYNQKASKACTSEDKASLQEQLERFKQCIPKDLPALIDSEDNSNDDDENRDLKSKNGTNKQTDSPSKKKKVKGQHPPAKALKSAVHSLQNGIAHRLAPGKDERQPAPRAEADSDAWIGKLQFALATGGAALLNEHYRQARSQFDVCISLITTHSPPLPIVDGVSLQLVNLPLLRYSCGVACFRRNTLQDITVSMEYFKVSMDSTDGQKFPLAYYGLGQALMQLGRYHAARTQLTSGLQVLSYSITVPPKLMWPGTNAVIEETSQLKSSFEDALLRCRYPPKADAVCVYDECLSNGNAQREIYSFACCFEGLVTVLCSYSCCMRYHIKCWQHLKSKHWEKTANKDVVGRPCFTPSCGGSLTLIRTVVRRDGEDKPNEVSCPVLKSTIAKPKRPLFKLPAQSVRAIERKLERKRLHKERRTEVRQRLNTADGPAEQSSTHMTSGGKSTGTAGDGREVNSAALRLRMTTEEPVAILKKEKEINFQEDHSKHKNAKKKVKPKTVHLDEFIGKIHTDDDTDSASCDSYGHTLLWLDNRGQPSAPPVYLQHSQQPLEAIGGSIYPSTNYHYVIPDVRHRLVQFFEDLLRERGPMHVEDVVITRYLVDSFPPEALEAVSAAGGIGSFLKRYPQFDVIGDHLVLLLDGSLVSTTRAADEPLTITPRLMPDLPPQRPPPLMSDPTSLVSNWVMAPHGSAYAPFRYAPAHALTLPSYSYVGLHEPFATVPSLLEDPAAALLWTASAGGSLSAAASRSSSSIGGGGSYTSASRGSAAVMCPSVQSHGCAVGSRASLLDGFDRPRLRLAVASSSIGASAEMAIVSGCATPFRAAAAPAVAEERGSCDNLSGAFRDRVDSLNISRSSGSSNHSSLPLLQQHELTTPLESPPLSRCNGRSGSNGGRSAGSGGSVVLEEIDARPASKVAHGLSGGPPRKESELLSATIAGDALSALDEAYTPQSSASSSSCRAPSSGGAQLTPKGTVATAASAAAGAVLLPPVDVGVQVDGLSADCELLTANVLALGAELVKVKAEMEAAALERELLSAELQMSQAAVSRLTGELGRAEECVDGARAALGEYWRGGGGSSSIDLADDIANLRALLAAEEWERRAAEAARTEQVELTRRLQDELSSLRRRLLMESEQSDGESERARRAEVTVLELQYERAVAPMCALLQFCKQSLGRGGLLPNIASTYIAHVERLSRSILELKNRYQEQIRLVAGGRLASTLRDIRVAAPQASPVEQQILQTAVVPLQAIMDVPPIPKLNIPFVALASTALDVPPRAASLIGQPAAAAGHLMPEVRAVDRSRHQEMMAAATLSRTSDDRALDVLVAAYPGYSRREHAGHLMRLKAECERGTLTGLTLSAVVGRVGHLISADLDAQHSGGCLARSSSAASAASSTNKASVATPPALSAHSHWAVAPLPEAVVQAASVEVYQEESDPCIICHELMSPDETTRLSCQHKYHSTCIRDWFSVQQTCPLCRNFDLMPEDFPDLGSLKKA